MMKLKILITGASSGLGLTTALHLIARGHFVIGTCRNPQDYSREDLKTRVLHDHTRYRLGEDGNLKEVGCRLPRIFSQLDDLLNQLVLLPLDYCSPSSPKQCAAQFLERTAGEIDLLLLNAGFSIFGSVEEASIDLAKKQFETNLFGPLLLLKEFLPIMRTQGRGKVIFTSSLAAGLTIPFESHYSASKSALERIAEGLAMETRPFGIQIAVVEPGDINTAFNLTTVKSLQPIEGTSADLPLLLRSFPLGKNSPYYKRALNSWNYIMRTLPLKPSPSLVARAMVRLAERRQIGFRYRVGSLWQTVAASLAQRVFPETLKAWALTKIYELDRNAGRTSL